MQVDKDRMALRTIIFAGTPINPVLLKMTEIDDLVVRSVKLGYPEKCALSGRKRVIIPSTKLHKHKREIKAYEFCFFFIR